MVLASGKRSFTVLTVTDSSGKAKRRGKSNTGGRYQSRTPAGAAKKGFSKSCNNSAIRGQCTMRVTVQDTTAGARTYGKKYTYNVSRKVVNKKVKYSDGTVRVMKYEVKAKAA